VKPGGTILRSAVLPHITDDFAEAKSIQHILTHLENKQAKIGWF
jgi:hypothetical protein